MTTGEPTLDLMMALTDLAERLTVMALLLLIAFAFLRRWKAKAIKIGRAHV